MLCSYCQSPNLDDARFCDNCGKPLEQACPKCGQPVTPGAKFCRHCGQPLTHHPTPPSPISASDTQPTVEEGGSLRIGIWDEIKLEQYIPKELLAKLAAVRAEPSRRGKNVVGERRVVTMLFCDVKGSTAMAERLDPEEWADIMNGVFELLIAPIYRYEGTLARLMGDAILAFFGAPIAHEDEPQRAVRAGLDIVAGMQTYREQLKRERGLDLNVRVGLNTGLVVVGEVGSDLRVEYTAMGDAVNLAARMEQTALPGTVQITDDTYRLVAPWFDCEALGGVEVKGKSAPVPAFRVFGLKAQAGRLRGFEGWETPLVGRGTEMAALRQVIMEVQHGHGRVVCLLGEAGLGKSRLIQELRSLWRTTQTSKVELPFGVVPSWAESHGISYDTARPYGVFRQLFHTLTATTEADPPAVVREKLNTLMQADLPERRSRVIQVFEVLLAVEAHSPGSDQELLEGEALQRELFEATSSMIRSWTSARPLVMAFDDVHWADAASIELLLHLIQLADEGPVLFLCAFRPDRQSPAWQVKQTAERDYAHRYLELMLKPLSVEDSQFLLEHLPAITDLPAQIRQSILDRAEGNPFFTEEIVRSLMDNGVIVHDPAGWRAAVDVDLERIVIPTSVQTLLTARIDRLEEGTRRTLQLASVIGRSFYYRVLERVSGAQTDLDRQLRALQRADLIREAARQPELEYVFRHALTHEAAYNSILIKRRREFHRRVGEALETLMADRLEAIASLLGDHFYLAGDERALKYYLLAGEMADRLYANTEAVAHYTRALEIARRVDGADSAVLQQLYARRGRALELNARYREALDNYAEMETAAREMGDQPLELSALLLRVTIYATPNPERDDQRAQQLSEQALTLARQLGDRAAEARILWNMLWLNSMSGRSRDAQAYGEQSLAIARELNLREQLAFTLNDIFEVYWLNGDIAKARAAQIEARDLWRELGNLPMLSDNLARSGQLDLLSGDMAALIMASDEAYAISQAIGNRWGEANSRMLAGLAYWDMGEYGAAIAIMEEAAQRAEQVGHSLAIMFLRLVLANVYTALGAIASGLDIAEKVLSYVQEKQPFWAPLAQGVLAHLHMLNGDLPAAEAIWHSAGRALASGVNLPPFGYTMLFPLIQTEAEIALARSDHARALALADENSASIRRVSYRTFMPDMLCFKGKVLLAQDRIDLARPVLEEARAEAEAIGSRRSLWPILMALSEIAARGGNSVHAEDLRSRAREIVEYIADHIADPVHPLNGPLTAEELRASFFNLPEVRAARGQ